MIARYQLNIVRGRRHVALEVVVAELPAAQCFPLGEIIRASLGGFQTPRPARLEDAAHAGDLVVIDRADAQLVQLIPDHTRGFCSRLRLRLGVYHEYANLRRRVVVGAYG